MDDKLSILILDNKLCNIILPKHYANHILVLLKNRIRRITWLDEFSIKEAHECHRISKICYELVYQLEDKNYCGVVSITNVSCEEIDILLNFPKHWKTEELIRNLSDIRKDIRLSGPVSPIEQDRFAKEFIDIMES